MRVDRAYIESHGDTDDDSGDHSHHHGHDETDHDEMDHEEMDHPETVTVVMPDGNSAEYNVTPTGWDLLTIAAHQNNWTINSSLSSWGHMVSGINGEESVSYTHLTLPTTPYV